MGERSYRLEPAVPQAARPRRPREAEVTTRDRRRRRPTSSIPTTNCVEPASSLSRPLQLVLGLQKINPFRMVPVR